MPDIKSPPPLDYTAEQWHDYKKRLYSELANRGLHNLAILDDSQAKEFIGNYMDTEIVNAQADEKRLKENINIRLAHMEVVVQGTTFIFPIINEYIGHHLKQTYFFSKEKEGLYRVNIVEVIPKKVIITS